MLKHFTRILMICLFFIQWTGLSYNLPTRPLEHFKTLQSHGIDGIIIQLARGKKATDAGVNPFASQQIAGVRAVVLKLAVPFVSTAQSPEEALAEANELVAQIRSLGCPSDIPVVNRPVLKLTS